MENKNVTLLELVLLPYRIHPIKLGFDYVILSIPMDGSSSQEQNESP